MSVPRYYTVGAVARDLQALKDLGERLDASGAEPGSLIVLARRRDERLISVTLPGVRRPTVEYTHSRRQCFERASTFLWVTAVSVLMGGVNPATDLILQ